MTPQEAKKFLEEQKAQGASDNEILGTLYEMFKDDVIDVEELGELVGFIGYELTEEFKNMSPEDQKTKGWEGEEAEEEDEPTEGTEAPKEEEKTEPAQEAPAEAPKEEEAPKNDDNEEEEAKKLFGLNK